jgi:hypothetical protein
MQDRDDINGVIPDTMNDDPLRSGRIEFSDISMSLLDVIEPPLLISDDHLARRAYRSRTSSLVA